MTDTAVVSAPHTIGWARYMLSQGYDLRRRAWSTSQWLSLEWSSDGESAHLTIITNNRNYLGDPEPDFEDIIAEDWEIYEQPAGQASAAKEDPKAAGSAA
jgi:hypothetical protein